MTVSTTGRKKQFAGNDSTTAFDFDFRVDSSDDLTVILTDSDGSDTTLAETTDYTVTNLTNTGGRVNYPVSGDPLATGETLTVYRDTTATQTVDLINYGAYYPETLEGALDKMMMLLQELEEEIGRASLTAITGGDGEDALTQTEADLRYLKLSGGTVTGAVSYASDPTSDNELARKAYVDTMMPLAGGTFTGAPSYASDPTSDNELSRKAYTDTMMPLAGGTFTGAPSYASDPSGDNELARKAYVDTQATAATPKAGAGAKTTNGTSNTSSWVTVCTTSTLSSLTVGQKVLVAAGFQYNVDESTINGTVQYRILRTLVGTGDTEIVSAVSLADSSVDNEISSFVRHYVDTVASAGDHTYSIQVRDSESGASWHHHGSISAITCQ